MRRVRAVGSRVCGRMTALMLAAFNGHTNVCAALIIAGADISTTADLGYGPHRGALWSRWCKGAHGAGTLRRIFHVSAISRRSTPRLCARCLECSMQLAHRVGPRDGCRLRTWPQPRTTGGRWTQLMLRQAVQLCTRRVGSARWASHGVGTALVATEACLARTADPSDAARMDSGPMWHAGCACQGGAAAGQPALRLCAQHASAVRASPPRSCVTACAGWLQRLELLVTLMHARQRRSPTGAAGGVAPSEFAAAVAALPSGLLAMVAYAIVKLDSQPRLEARDTIALAFPPRCMPSAC